MFRARLARSDAAASSVGFDLPIFSSRMTRSSTVGLSSSCWIGALALDRVHRARARAAAPADSVGDCTPIAAFDRYFFGQTATAAAPAARHSTSGTTNHHLAAVDDRQVIERVKRLWLH